MVGMAATGMVRVMAIVADNRNSGGDIPAAFLFVGHRVDESLKHVGCGFSAGPEKTGLPMGPVSVTNFRQGKR